MKKAVIFIGRMPKKIYFFLNKYALDDHLYVLVVMNRRKILSF